MGEDAEANYAYYCLHKFHLLPSQFLALSEEEQAFIIASIDIRVEKEAEERKKLENKTK